MQTEGEIQLNAVLVAFTVLSLKIYLRTQTWVWAKKEMQISFF